MRRRAGGPSPSCESDRLETPIPYPFYRGLLPPGPFVRLLAEMRSDQMSRTRTRKAGSYGWIALQVFLTGVAYYVATEIAWALCFPNSKVSLLFPPHAVLVVILLLVPVRHWWA